MCIQCHAVPDPCLPLWGAQDKVALWTLAEWIFQLLHDCCFHWKAASTELLVAWLLTVLTRGLMFFHTQPALVFWWAVAVLHGRQLSCFKTSDRCAVSDLYTGHWRTDWKLKLCSSCLAFRQNGFKIWMLPCHQGTMQQVLEKAAPWNGKGLFTCRAEQPHWYTGDFSPCDFQHLPQHQTDSSKRLRTEGNIWYPFKAKTSDLMKTVSEWDMIQISNYICLAQHSLINHSNI